MNEGNYAEQLILSRPVTIRRRVKWGDCDPAGVVFTPVFSDYIVSAYHSFLAEILGGPIFGQMRARGFETPIKALSLEFKRMLATDDVFDMSCLLRGVRNRSFDLDVIGHVPGNRALELFVGRVSPILFSPKAQQTIAIPEDLRLALENYRAESGN